MSTDGAGVPVHRAAMDGESRAQGSHCREGYMMSGLTVVAVVFVAYALVASKLDL